MMKSILRSAFIRVKVNGMALVKSLCLLFALLTVAACDPNTDYRSEEAKQAEEEGSILDWFKGNQAKAERGEETSRFFSGPIRFNGKELFAGSDQPQVNENIWRAAYNVASVLPISTANRQRGLIETHWYAPPGITHEQMRLVILVGAGQINRSAVKVNAFRRGFDAQGQVVQTPANPRVIDELERAIIKKAQALRG